MWKVGNTYPFVPSGDATELLIKIVAEAPMWEALRWYENTYSRLMLRDATKAFKALVVKGGRDADIVHRKGDVYYVFDTDYEEADV